MAQPICSLCNHYRKNFTKIPVRHQCLVLGKTDVVTGEPISRNCYRQRSNNGPCKKEGLLFQLRLSDALGDLVDGIDEGLCHEPGAEVG